MRKIIALVGLCGSGKSECSLIFENKGFKLIKINKLVDDELKKRNFEINEINRKNMRNEIKKLYGKSGLIFLAINEIEKYKDNENIIIDGLYSWDEYILLFDKFNEKLKIINIFCDKDIRYNRLENRTNRQLNKDIIKKRDFNEIKKLNKGKVIAIADYTIINNKNIKNLEKEIEIILKKI